MGDKIIWGVYASATNTQVVGKGRGSAAEIVCVGWYETSSEAGPLVIGSFHEPLKLSLEVHGHGRLYLMPIPPFSIFHLST